MDPRFLETQGKGTENSGVSGPLASPRFHPPPTPIATGGNSSTLTTARPADPKVGRDRAARAVETIIKSRPGLKPVNHQRLWLVTPSLLQKTTVFCRRLGLQGERAGARADASQLACERAQVAPSPACSQKTARARVRLVASCGSQGECYKGLARARARVRVLLGVRPSCVCCGVAGVGRHGIHGRARAARRTRARARARSARLGSARLGSALLACRAQPS